MPQSDHLDQINAFPSSEEKAVDVIWHYQEF
jgi:hypothetical protein